MASLPLDTRAEDVYKRQRTQNALAAVRTNKKIVSQRLLTKLLKQQLNIRNLQEMEPLLMRLSMKSRQLSMPLPKNMAI